MLILITYDVSTQTDAGRRRLRQVAKCCQNYGLRVQNSVFECVLDASQYKLMQHRLQALINPKEDSLRFYNLGNHFAAKVIHVGAKAVLGVEEPLIL